jgi:hypothetical protein
VPGGNSQSSIVLACQVVRGGAPCGRVAPAQFLAAWSPDGTEVVGPAVTCLRCEDRLARAGWTTRRVHDA